MTKVGDRYLERGEKIGGKSHTFSSCFQTRKPEELPTEMKYLESTTLWEVILYLCYTTRKAGHPSKNV